jgi:hypothetical protein
MDSAFVRNQRRLPAADTPDLFAANQWPDGFRYIPDVLSVAEEKSLVEWFEKLPLKPFEFHGYLANRRIYSFGHKYVFAGQEPRKDGSIPDYLRPLVHIASRISGQPADAFEQAMVTEYASGAGIGWHRDRPSYEDIVSVSFLAPPARCASDVRRAKGGNARPCPSLRDLSTFCMGRRAKSGNTASRPWTCCVTP